MSNKDHKFQIRSKIRWGVVGIVALIIISVSYDIPKQFNRAINKINAVTALGIPNIPEDGFALGLDLQGGAHLIYEADVRAIAANERATSVEGVRDVIERRVNGIGVGEPSIQTTKVGDNYRIIVELPGIKDVNQAIAMIGETPILEFREQNNDPPRVLTAEEQVGIDTYNSEAKLRAEKALAEIQDESLTFEEAVQEYSEDLESKNNDGYLGFIGSDHINTTLATWAFTSKDGEISKALIKDDVGFFIARAGGTREGEKEVEASHILICYLGSGCDTPIYNKEEAQAKANEVFGLANVDNFTKLAADFSDDISNKDNGGYLGSFKKGAMVPVFEEAVFAAGIGEIVGPVESQFGYHIIYKTNELTQKEHEVSVILVRTQSAVDILPPNDPFKATELSGAQLERAEVVSDNQTGAVQVSLQFDNEGKELFKKITTEHVGEPIAIYLDGQPISVPTVQQPITDGRAVITGSFNIQEARLLTQRLNAGALPVPIDLVSQQSVGASLGAESLQKSLKAGMVSLVLVMVFMLLFYRLPGVVSIIALVLYLSLTLAIFKLIGVTLTLAGIAGFILSIGLAVDANVLIFERLREELSEGKSLKAGVEEGFLRAWTSIRDGNISTLITCALLIWFGSSFVQGFAVTLALGILISMFSAITVTRVLLRFVVPWFDEDANWMFLGAKKTNL
jgi:protein-export membrane protein SecD